MIGLEVSDEKHNKRIDPRWEDLSYNERDYALEFLHLLVEAEDGVNNIFKHQK